MVRSSKGMPAGPNIVRVTVVEPVGAASVRAGVVVSVALSLGYPAGYPVGVATGHCIGVTAGVLVLALVGCSRLHTRADTGA